MSDQHECAIIGIIRCFERDLSFYCCTNDESEWYKVNFCPICGEESPESKKTMTATKVEANTKTFFQKWHKVKQLVEQGGPLKKEDWEFLYGCKAPVFPPKNAREAQEEASDPCVHDSIDAPISCLKTVVGKCRDCGKEMVVPNPLGYSAPVNVREVQEHIEESIEKAKFAYSDSSIVPIHITSLTAMPSPEGVTISTYRKGLPEGVRCWLAEKQRELERNEVEVKTMKQDHEITKLKGQVQMLTQERDLLREALDLLREAQNVLIPVAQALLEKAKS